MLQSLPPLCLSSSILLLTISFSPSIKALACLTLTCTNFSFNLQSDLFSLGFFYIIKNVPYHIFLVINT